MKYSFSFVCNAIHLKRTAIRIILLTYTLPNIYQIPLKTIFCAVWLRQRPSQPTESWKKRKDHHIQNQNPLISCTNSNIYSKLTLLCNFPLALISISFGVLISIYCYTHINTLLECSDEVGFIHPSQFAKLTEEADDATDIPTSECPSFWNRDHKFGVSTLVLLPLYNAAKLAFMAAIGEYKRLGPDVVVSGDGLESEVMKHSRALLLLSPDFGTAWNSRSLSLCLWIWL